MFIDFFGFPLFHLAGMVLVLLAYNNTYNVTQDGSNFWLYALPLLYDIQYEATTLFVIEIGRMMHVYNNQGNWLWAHYLKLDDDTRDWWRENAMFQRWLLGQGVPI